jgi:hypothetical protein
MSLVATLPAAILDTILARLALLFLSAAAGDMAAARDAAARMLAEHQPQTEDELRLAANIIGFSFHALQALGQAMTPDMPLNRVLRLRGSAVSLSRESHKAQRRLDLVRSARGTQPTTETAPQAPPPEASPSIQSAIALIEETGKVAAVAKANGVTWSQAYHQRERANRIAAKLKKNQGAHAVKLKATSIAPPVPHAPLAARADR